MFSIYFLLGFMINAVLGSHYRGGTMSYSIDENSRNNGEIFVVIVQRHSWRRSAFFCNDTSLETGDIIGEGILRNNPNGSSSGLEISQINTTVRCTDYNEEFDYSSGESSTIVSLPINKTIEYIYQGCCWIQLLSLDRSSEWSLKLIINTKQRFNGTLNNSPKTTMNPIVEVQYGRIHIIRIPMVDSDGDSIQCRWGQTNEECGSICAPIGYLRSNPCELTYNATQIGYHAIALIIEDFDSNNIVLSSIPLQFLIHIVNITTEYNCSETFIYIGELSEDSCIGIQSNETFQTHLIFYIPCKDENIILTDILTVSPAGLIKGNIIRDEFNQSLYRIPIEWTPLSDQYGLHQFCFIPTDSKHRTGSQICLTFHVDIKPPEFINMKPIGLVSVDQSIWTIETDHDIIQPKRSNGIYIRFFKHSTNKEVYRIDVTNSTNIFYQSRQIQFLTTNYFWEQGEEYYILLSNGIAILDQSCGIESVSLNDPNRWRFRIAISETTSTDIKIATITSSILPTTESNKNTIKSTTSIVQSTCPQWFYFNRISNESTTSTEPNFIFCFTIETDIADVTIAANTWTSCMTWKSSGAADPLLELYNEPENILLAQNDDGNSLTFENCYAAIISYRLQKGNYRVIIRNPKCAYGRFQLRLTAEINRNLK